MQATFGDPSLPLCILCVDNAQVYFSGSGKRQSHDLRNFSDFVIFMTLGRVKEPHIPEVLNTLSL